MNSRCRNYDIPAILQQRFIQNLIRQEEMSKVIRPNGQFKSLSCTKDILRSRIPCNSCIETEGINFLDVPILDQPIHKISDTVQISKIAFSGNKFELGIIQFFLHFSRSIVRLREGSAC
jgi:hypothetical protein